MSAPERALTALLAAALRSARASRSTDLFAEYRLSVPCFVSGRAPRLAALRARARPRVSLLGAVPLFRKLV